MDRGFSAFTTRRRVARWAEMAAGRWPAPAPAPAGTTASPTAGATISATTAASAQPQQELLQQPPQQQHPLGDSTSAVRKKAEGSQKSIERKIWAQEWKMAVDILLLSIMADGGRSIMASDHTKKSSRWKTPPWKKWWHRSPCPWW
ncbi:hypothetical protein HRR80_003457 [Exophiala dermatitidis]|uniref:Uncharacterized protein n=1 Tax=Exophiala dermatitidis TaxID=5970 RepID=A0AAN6EXU2_EXODE|nr:hypothetical protein HRR80_003457 [Exophiala dermatitidis]